MANRFNVNNTRNPQAVDLLGAKGDNLNNKAFFYNLIYNNHIQYLINIVTSMYTWSGLPGNVRSSYVETILSLNGSIALSDLPDYGLTFTPATAQGGLNLRGEPVRITLQPMYQTDFIYGMDVQLEQSEDVFAFGRNDNMCVGFYPLIQQTAKQLTEVYMSMDANIGQQKFPVIVRSSKNNKLSVDFAIDKRESYEPYIVLKDNGELPLEQSKVFGANIPYVADKLQQSYQDLLNNFFMRIGINYIPNAKKERMITDEVNANNQAVMSAGDVYYQNRMEFATRINDVFGLDVSVRRNVDVETGLKQGSSSTYENELGGRMDE